jgi:hypothetical protein
MPKISELTAGAAVTTDDLFPVVDNPGGTPVTKRVTGTQVADFVKGTIPNATTGAAGYMSSTDKTKLDGIATGAEVNQNAFSTIAVSGQSNVEADAKTDTLTFAAGTRITLTTNATTDTVTIATTAPALASTGTPANLAVAAALGADTTNAARADHVHAIPADFLGVAVSNVNASINNQSGATYTLLAADNAKTVVFANGCTVTVPAALPVGFNCTIVQAGTGQVVLLEGAGVVIRHPLSHLRTNTQWSVVSLVEVATNAFVLSGDTAF